MVHFSLILADVSSFHINVKGVSLRRDSSVLRHTLRVVGPGLSKGILHYGIAHTTKWVLL